MKIYNPKTGKFEDEEEKQGNISANVYNPSSKQFENIKPVKNQEEKKSTWFNAGALQDGYQPFDITKTILGTGADVAHRVVKGVAKVGEGIGDLAGYGAAQVVESLGNKNYADEMRKAANESLTDKVLAPVDKILDKNSILGKKSQGVGESLGQILAYSATGGLGKGVGTATMFTSAAGSAGNEAYSKENVKNEQAWAKILAGGAISAATEKAFGLFGKSGLDTAVANKISSKLTKGMSKTLARLGVQATSEALEELMEYTGNQLLDLGIDAASQGKGAKFHEDWNWEEVGQQMAMAAIASGIVGAGTTALGVKGTQGSNLNEKINNYAELIDIQEGVKPKEQVKLPGIRTEQSLTNNIEELKEQQRETTDNKLKQELATRISGLEQELNQFKLPMASTEGMNLMESASKYNIKPETQSAVQNLMENRGIESRWDATKFSDNSVNALWTKDANGNRSVIFNPNASLDTIVEEVAVHELTHDILSSENTTLNAQEILDYVSQLDGYNEARQSLENTYSTMYDPNSAEFNSLIDEEVVADVLGRKLGNKEFINQLVNSKPSIAKSIYNWVVSKLNSIVNRKGIKNEKLYWQNIKNNFEDAYKQEYKNNEMASTKYKVSTTTDNEVDNYIQEKGFTFQKNGNLEVNNLTDKQIKDLVKLYKQTGYEDVSSDYLTERLKSGQMPIQREVADRFIEKELGHKPQYDTTQIFEDAEGNPLTKEQVEFYKDSGVRDIRGRLIPVYHRTNADFTIFDDKAGTQHGKKYGKGFYFSITPENYGNNTMKVYLNAKDGEFKYVPKMGYYIVQESNQIKNVDNTNPTTNEDIRYSKENAEWNEFLDNNFNDIRDRAKKELGTTTNMNEAGYLTNDGEYLDFSGKKYGSSGGSRQMDHRDIADIYTDEEYDSAEKKYSNMGSATAILQDFIDKGNIRLNGTGVEIATEPTEQQYDKLYDYLEKVQRDNGEVFVDLDTETKNRENLEYNDKTSIRKIINDIKEHYNNSQENVVKDNQGRELSKQQQEYFKDSKARDSQGRLITLYHGTQDYDFNEFMGGTFLTDDYMNADGYASGERVIEAYANIKNPLVIECNGAKWDNLDTPYGTSTREIASGLDEGKYDGIIFKNINDNWIDDEEAGYPGDVYYVPNSNQIKEVDNENPTSNPDIRYSKENAEWNEFLDKNITKDNQGNEVAPGMQKYMSDSKARVDEDLNKPLVRVYHGSTGGDFTIFDNSYGNVEGDFGKGFYFSNQLSDVEAHYEDGGEDFENKVSRLAERIEQEEEISYDEAKEKARNQLYKGGNKFIVYLNITNPAIVGKTRLFNYEDYLEDIEQDLQYEAESYQEEIEDYTKVYFNNENIDNLSEQDLKEARDEYLREQGIYDDIINRYLEDDIENAVDVVNNNLEIYNPEELRNLLWESVYDGGIEVQELKDKINNQLEISDENGDLANNEAVRLILESLGYDGIIDKTVSSKFKNMGLDEDTTHYIVFNSNQIKNVDNTTPTTNDDIRYSTQSENWDKWNNKTIAPEGTKTKLKDIKLPKKEINLPKSTQVKQETRQEVKLPTRETITKEEIEELDSLKALNEITDLSREEQNKLDYLEKKQQGYTERYPGLKKVTDFKEISKEYGKYRDLDNFDRTLLRDAESMIKDYRNTGRRTKEQWLSIARYIGSNFKGNSQELQKYAIQSWFAAAPNQKGSLNRQGKGFVDFKIQEWINSMYDGARVGELDKPSTPKKQTILPMAREDNVLKVNANEIADFMNGVSGNQRGWAKTATKSDVLKDKVLIKDLDANKLNYVVESNQKSVDTANNHLNTYGYEKSLEDVKSLLRSDKLPKASDVALAERVLQEAVRNGDTKTAQDLIMDIAILGTDLGQATQALSIIKRLTPEGQLSMYTKMIQRAKSRGEKSFENVEITPEMVEMVLNAYKSDGTYDQEDLNNRVENFKQEIANQMKTTTGEKINAWRYLAMLGNPKTHIRNIVSNVAMNGTIKVKNAMARTLESVLPVANRTKTWKKASNFIKNYAETTANEMKGIITGENKYNEKSSLESKKRTFKSDTLEKLSTLNSNALEAEDWFFSKRAFKSNLEEYLTANGINTQEDIENNPEVVKKAQNYAKEQAEIATFRQYSKLAAQINNLEKNNKLARTFIEATVPFKKTPINVAKAGVKYSPLGLIKSLSYDIYQVKQGNMEASQLIDNISQGLTGTSLAILGYALAKNGILNGGGDDDKEGKYDTQLGDNQYSLKIGDKSYSISWLSPVAMPLLVGANAFEQLEEKEEWDMNVVSETLAKTLDPLNEMSFMQGLTNALSSYDKGVEKLAGIGESVAQNYVGQFFPTIFSQFASTIDDKKRSTKASANSTYKFGEQTLRSIMYKLPGLRQKLEVATDVWGNEKEQADNIIQRAYESFLAPYSTTKNITSDLDKEIKSIYNKTNETGVIPSVPYSYIKYKDETYRMSANDYTKYKKTFGQNANKYLNNLISSNAYKNASDDDKAKMIKNTYDYAKAEANEEYFKSQSIDYTSDTLKELNALKKIGINDKSLPEYISNKTLASTIKSDSQLSANEKHQKIADNFIKSNLNDKQLAYLYGKYYSTDDKLNNLVELNIPIKEFIKLNSQDIESDYNERTGKTISNSKKNKVINYVNSLNLSVPQKAILIKSQYNTYKNYDNVIVDYVNNLNKSVNDKKVILKSIGFDNYDNDVINYINSQNMSIKDKEKKLKSLGFTIRDGRVYK